MTFSNKTYLDLDNKKYLTLTQANIKHYFHPQVHLRGAPPPPERGRLFFLLLLLPVPGPRHPPPPPPRLHVQAVRAGGADLHPLPGGQGGAVINRGHVVSGGVGECFPVAIVIAVLFLAININEEGFAFFSFIFFMLFSSGFASTDSPCLKNLVRLWSVLVLFIFRPTISLAFFRGNL